jgi:hypothetical protein
VKYYFEYVDSFSNPLAIDEYTQESEIIKNSTPELKTIYTVLKQHSDYPILQMINDLRKTIQHHETKQDLCIDLIKTKYPMRYAYSTVFVECLKATIDNNSDFIFRLQLEPFYKILHTKIQQDFALKLDEAQKQFETPKTSQLTQKADKETDNNKKTKTFSDYLYHTNKDALIKKLQEVLNGKKGREVAKILMALEQKSYIIIPTKELDKVRKSMIEKFGDVGTQQSISRYYKKKDPNGNTLIPQSEIQAIIDVLS